MNRKSIIVTLSAIASVFLLFAVLALLSPATISGIPFYIVPFLLLAACFALPVWITVLLRTARNREWFWFASSIVFVEVAPIVTFLYGLIAVE